MEEHLGYLMKSIITKGQREQMKNNEQSSEYQFTELMSITFFFPLRNKFFKQTNKKMDIKYIVGL